MKSERKRYQDRGSRIEDRAFLRNELGILSHSSLLAPRPSGITLVEVLISMGILVIGLLSVMAMLPAGSKYMQQGEIADRGAAIAQAAFADLVTKGMLNPEAWRVFAD